MLIGWVFGVSVNFGLYLSGNKMKVWGMFCFYLDVLFLFISIVEYLGRGFYFNLEDFINF